MRIVNPPCLHGGNAEAILTGRKTAAFARAKYGGLARVKGAPEYVGFGIFSRTDEGERLYQAVETQMHAGSKHLTLQTSCEDEAYVRENKHTVHL